jgi:Fe-S-cluster containining protein
MPKNENPCDGCGGKCCTYVAVELDKPKSKSDFADMIYYLHHEHVKISIVQLSKKKRTWYLQFDGRCRHLNDAGLCEIYELRPKVCSDHSAEECEEHQKESFTDVATVPELLAFMESIGKKKWAEKLRAAQPAFLQRV